jgi:hypothetical protein
VVKAKIIAIINKAAFKRIDTAAAPFTESN